MTIPYVDGSTTLTAAEKAAVAALGTLSSQNANTVAITGGTIQGVTLKIGTGSLVCQGAALPTTATDGFLYIPTCAGTPTGVPTVQAGTVPMVYDTVNHVLCIYDGGRWT
jgi:hypothetical protein